MKLSMRFARALAAIVVSCSGAAALAQDYPVRTIKFVVPSAPGTGVDAIALPCNAFPGRAMCLLKRSV